VLSNLFLHYYVRCLDGRTFPDLPWCRYAVTGWFTAGLSRGASCQGGASGKAGGVPSGNAPGQDPDRLLQGCSRKGKYPNTQFDFLGYTFRRRIVKNRKRNSIFVNFTPAVSAAALKSMRQTTREARYQTRTYLSVTDISRLHNPVLRGWLSYYGKFSRRRSIRFSGTSTRRWLPGQCASISA